MTTSNSPKLYLSCPSTSIPCPQVLGYTLGKTLGSGKFAKVKAAWSPYELRMVREVYIFASNVIANVLYY